MGKPKVAEKLLRSRQEKQAQPEFDVERAPHWDTLVGRRYVFQQLISHGDYDDDKGVNTSDDEGRLRTETLLPFN